MAITIEKLRNNIEHLTYRRDQHMKEYYECCGAIVVLNEQLKTLVDEIGIDHVDEHNYCKLNEQINDIIKEQDKKE